VKVLIFTTQWFQLSGAERLSLELAAELNRHGVPTDLLSMYRPELPGVPTATEALAGKGRAVHFLGLCIRPSVGEVMMGAWRLRQFLRKKRYDIVETSLLGPTALAAIATQGLQTRQIAGIHRVVRRQSHAGGRWQVWRLATTLNRRIRFYAISQSVLDHWLEYSGRPAERARVVYNSIADDYFGVAPDPSGLRAELGIAGEGRLILFVGRLHKSKGVDTVLDALGPILSSMNLHLLYVGEYLGVEGLFSAEAELLAAMRKRIAQQGWTERVRFLGRRNDVPRLMASSDLLVHPAHTEGFGLVLAEALATGLPVVASNVDGIPEVLWNTDSLMVPPGDTQALRSAVLRVLRRTPAEAAGAAEKGRIRSDHFRSRRRANDLIRLFEDSLSGRW
jgi:glycosyltransferase involved in cell wall biosynthesis